ncbi:hypothetical protein HYV88_01545 [Candidatus Woesearchaeota archaeon]|nr:hypothetical protein [Candidatus Woesearchaeota archaeon]
MTLIKTTKEVSEQEIGLFTEAKTKFRSPKLLYYIHEELSKDHINDDNEKMTGFIGTCTSKLKPSSLRKSIKFSGDTSVGKDNLMRSILKHFPDDSYIFLTNATRSVMEDDIAKYDIICYSEVNKEQIDGANYHLKETIKQMSEGGTISLKKDVLTGYKTTRTSKQEQKTVLYSTTEISNDEESATRFIDIALRGNPNKTRAVNEDTIIKHGDPLTLIESQGNNNSWIKKGFESLKVDYVLIPYWNYLLEDEEGKEIINYDNPRSQRDLKKLLAFTCAISWLFQLQRYTIEINGIMFVVSEPQDFLNAVKICGRFFNQSYKGFDERLQTILDFVEEYTKGDFTKPIPREIIQRSLSIKSKNTIKKRIRELEDKNLIEFSHKEGNSVFYRRCQGGSQSGLINMPFDDLFEHLSHFNIIEAIKEYTPIYTPINHPEFSLDLIFDLERQNKEQDVKNLFPYTVIVRKSSTVLPKKIDTLEIIS